MTGGIDMEVAALTNWTRTNKQDAFAIDQKQKTNLQKLLELMSDNEEHDNFSLAMVGGPSFNQVINLRLRPKGFRFAEPRHIHCGLWVYKLLTPKADIDFENCCLKKKVVD